MKTNLSSTSLLLSVMLFAAASSHAQQPTPAPPANNPPPAVRPAPAIAANAPHAADIRAARQAAEMWIAMLDAGKFDQAYAQMGQTARGQISLDQWKAQLNATRMKYGKLDSRAFQYTDYTTTMKNAPAGQYVLLDYLCTFTSRQSAPETIVMAKDGTGWHVAGFAVE